VVSARSHKISRVSCYSGYVLLRFAFGYAAFTLIAGLSSTFLLACFLHCDVRTPRCTHHGLGSSAFARRYLRNHCCFLFLRLLRCFSSPGSLRIPMNSVYGTWPSTMWVAPFRHPRIKGYVLLPVAFRSLSRLSSALSAKASTLRPSLLNLLEGQSLDCSWFSYLSS
jgi:hypothetical protein